MINVYKSIIIRLGLIIFIVAGGFYAFTGQLYYTTCFLFLIFILQLLELFSFINSAFQFYDKTISAILNNDFTADFSRQEGYKSDNYKSLFKLYNVLKERQHDQVTKELIYQSILNNIETGVVILQEGEQGWDILLINDYFTKLFGIPKVSRWKYLWKQVPALCTIIEEQQFTDLRTSVQIKAGSSESQMFMLQGGKTVAFGKEYYIILLDSIQKVVAKKEKDAWINLMKVISHELMNSITPIRSLAQNLNEMAHQEEFTNEDVQDMRQSLSTMIHRSDHLQNFIESYRTLAMLPLPQKNNVDISRLIHNVLGIMALLLKQNNVLLTNDIIQPEWIHVDEQQMEQVFINLITNSIYALTDVADKQIKITASVEEGRLHIGITDNGLGIEKEIQDKIFMPFFTTRKSGAGIGLTLSKNIVEAHGGYLSHSSDEDGNTMFTVSLFTT
nr:HAMP domain-containing sensor histidine kinase [uncultured Flavobacterium sp.]